MFGRRRRDKKPKKPAMILRLAWRWGYKPGRVMTEVLEWIEVGVVALALAAIIMSFVTVRMHVPTGSMIPTIDPKDSFFVDRVTYYFRDPKPGDVVVFRHTEQVLIKGVVEGTVADQAGIDSGDRLLFLNTDPVYTRAFAENLLAAWPEGTELQLTTAEGGRFELGVKTAGIDSFDDLGIIVRERRMRYVKRLIATEGQTVQIKDGDIYVDGARLDDERFDRTYVSRDSRFRFGIEPTVVPENHYFMLGDNSTDSFDSRYWGFVDDRDIIGVPYLRVWPLSRFGPM